MPGPTPKPAALRQRRNKVAGATTLSGGGRTVRFPRLPKLLNKDQEPVTWHPWVVRWWRAIWRSPVESEIEDVDLDGLYQLALVKHHFYNGAIELAAEIRLERRDYGLTPLDRSRLHWEVERGEQAETRTKQRHVRSAQAGDEDPRKALQVLAG